MHASSTHDDFYVAVASVMPILLLALLWDSGYLRRLRSEQRILRRSKPGVPGGVLFWTKGRVLIYSLFVTAAVLCAIGAAALVLADIVRDTAVMRYGEAAVLVLELATIFTRIAVDLVAATRGDGSASANPTTAATSVQAVGLAPHGAAAPETVIGQAAPPSA